MNKNIRGEFTEVADTEGIPLVSVAEGSLDMRPALDQIEDIILACKGDKPLVIMTGEVHDVVSHVVMPQLIMQRLKQSNPDLTIAHGIERAHNLHEILTRGRDDVPEGQSLADAYVAYENALGVPVTRRNVMEFCRNNGISVRAVDMPSSPEYEDIDQSDSSTRAVIERHAPELLDARISGGSADGLKVRNFMALERTKAHIAESGADIYVLPYGGAHLFGWTRMDDRNEGPYPTQDSLGQMLYDDPDVDVLVFFQSAPGLGPEKIPEDTDHGLLGRGVIVEGLNPQSYWQKRENTAEVNADLAVQEAIFLREMARQSPGALHLSPEVEALAARAPAQAGPAAGVVGGVSERTHEA